MCWRASRACPRESLLCVLDLPENSYSSRGPPRLANQGKGCHLDVPTHAIRALAPHGPVGWPSLVQGGEERVLLWGDRHAVFVCQHQGIDPLVFRHLACLLESHRYKLLGWFIVEEQGPYGVNDNDRHCQVTGELPD